MRFQGPITLNWPIWREFFRRIIEKNMSIFWGTSVLKKTLLRLLGQSNFNLTISFILTRHFCGSLDFSNLRFWVPCKLTRSSTRIFYKPTWPDKLYSMVHKSGFLNDKWENRWGSDHCSSQPEIPIGKFFKRK